MPRLLLFLIFFLLSSTSLVYSQDMPVRLADEYYSNGELDKALVAYEKLSKDSENIPLIYSNYLQTLLDLEEYDKAEKFVKNVDRRNGNPLVKIDYALVLKAGGDSKAAQKELDQLLKNIRHDNPNLAAAAAYLQKKGELGQAERFYLEGRSIENSQTLHGIELISIYKAQNRIEPMLDEYVKMLNTRALSLEAVKNQLQTAITSDEDKTKLKKRIYAQLQSNPGDAAYSELLIWLHVQDREFDKAFFQARAMDKRFKQQGLELLSLADIAVNNNELDAASEIYSYIIENYDPVNGANQIPMQNYYPAVQKNIEVSEKRLERQYPINKGEVRDLILQYETLKERNKGNVFAFQAAKAQASLYGRYLDKYDTAVQLLQEIIDGRRVPADLLAQTKITLADIYLLRGEPWEASLILSQVEKANKDSPIAYEAKLRNAKINYYEGEFELAQSHLDILKQATSREIANDAMDLSLLIQDNLALDTNTEAMMEFASIDLLLFKNRNDSALVALESMLKRFPDHSLTDEIFFRQAKIYRKIGRFDAAVSALDKIEADYPKDILGDNAAFLKAQIYEFDIKDKEKAMVVYKNILLNYPGSTYAVESRKRFRLLRGDNLNQ